jgi:hypothetical protein
MNKLEQFIEQLPCGFLRGPADTAELIKLDRFFQVLVRCGGCRFTCSVQYLDHLCKCVAAGKEGLTSNLWLSQARRVRLTKGNLMDVQTLNQTDRDWIKWVYERAKRYEQRIPENGWLYMMELSGPDGAHYTLFAPPGATHDDIRKAKAYCQNNWDCTGFTVVTGIELVNKRTRIRTCQR